MFRPTLRIASTAPLARAVPRPHVLRRFVSTAPPHQKSRSWKSSVARWGLAGALVYYYNTASVFAEEPAYADSTLPETARENETYDTVASISEQKRAQSRSQPQTQSNEVQSVAVAVPDREQTAPGSPEALEEEASEQGAFNEETGEINWDCPCLGGMAYGPCGEQFRAAFSCFVFSKEEPKGVDCIEHFKSMQNCFREHPDIYGAELDDDEEDGRQVVEGEPVPSSTEPLPAPAPSPQVASVDSASSNEIPSSARLEAEPGSEITVQQQPQQREQSPRINAESA